MPFFIVKGDITKMKTDAIVNAANKSLLGGGGVDGAIHRAAGAELLSECRTLGGCKTGEAKITKGYKLPAKYIIHTVGPVWRGGLFREKELLSSCYRNSLELATEYQLGSIAFPLISSGVYGYPKDKALNTAVHEIRSFLNETDSDMTVYMVIYDTLGNRHKFTEALNNYIDDTLVMSDLQELYSPSLQKTFTDRSESMPLSRIIPDVESEPSDELKEGQSFHDGKAKIYRHSSQKSHAAKPAAEREYSLSLSGMLENLDMSFSEMLFKLIDERSMTDAQCYKAANLDRRHFSKIRSEKSYHPSKNTCIALCIALRLDFDDAAALLRTAGYAFTHSSKFDVIIEYFINMRIYDIDTINEALFDNDQILLGA